MTLTKEEKNLYLRNYRKKNKDILKQKRLLNKEKNSKNAKEWRLKNKEKLRLLQKKIRDSKTKEQKKLEYEARKIKNGYVPKIIVKKTIQEKKITAKNRYIKKSKEICEKQRIRRLNNLEFYRLKDKERYQKRKNSGATKEYSKKKYHSDFNIRLKLSLSKRMRDAVKAIKNSKKLDTFFNLTGCNMLYLKKHIESKFYNEMKWENYGKVWEIDHKVPCSYFNLTTLKAQKICFNYLNLQPLLVKENKIKSNKIEINDFKMLDELGILNEKYKLTKI